ncbi:MAG: hypothetical protein ABEK36_05255 [Candidatus Aenigmatarchaeota archaeon]
MTRIDEQLNSIQPLNTNNTNPKELFESKDVEVKTELSSEQVMIISRLKILGEKLKTKYDSNMVNNLIDNFLKLQISKDRASRKEFVSSFQSKNDERIGSVLDNFSMNLGNK